VNIVKIPVKIINVPNEERKAIAHIKVQNIVYVQYNKYIIQECSHNTALFVVNAYIGFTSECTLE
jgi:hypothetical protein